MRVVRANDSLDQNDDVVYTEGEHPKKTSERRNRIFTCICFLCFAGGMFALVVVLQNAENERIIRSPLYALITSNITRKWIAPSGQNQNGQNPSGQSVFQLTAFNFPERRFAWSYANVPTSASWFVSFTENDNTIIGFTKGVANYYDDLIYGSMIGITRKSDVQLAIKFDYRDTSKKSVDSLFDALP